MQAIRVFARGVATGLTKPVKVSKELAKVIGQETSSRTEITKGVWAYIKKNNLQDPAAKSVIKCDDTLKAIFDGRDSIKHTELLKLVQPHISKLE